MTVERLRAEADRDYLTGLANRRRFRKALGKEVERWRRYQFPCALLLAERVGRARETRPTLPVDSGQRCQVLRTKPLTLPALWQEADRARALPGSRRDTTATMGHAARPHAVPTAEKSNIGIEAAG